MSVTVQGRVPRKWGDEAVSHLTRRLQILERALAGGADRFLAPSVPTFGSGTVSGGAGSSPSGGTSPGGSTGGNHGALTGLLDDDHPQYAPRSMAFGPHQHDVGDVVNIESQFLRRLESFRAHTHRPEELDLDSRFYRRGERVPTEAHTHSIAEMSDLNPADMQFILASRIFGG